MISKISVFSKKKISPLFYVFNFLSKTKGMAGVSKLSPILDPEAHKNLHEWAKSWTGVVGIPVQYSDLYCNAIGTAEAIGALLILIPQTTLLANLLFIAIMCKNN